jgi:hypothetical protein
LGIIQPTTFAMNSSVITTYICDRQSSARFHPIRHARESGHPVPVTLEMNIGAAEYWIIGFRG